MVTASPSDKPNSSVLAWLYYPVMLIHCVYYNILNLKKKTLLHRDNKSWTTISEAKGTNIS